MIKSLIILFILSPFIVQAIVFPERDIKGRPIQRKAGVETDENTRVRFIGTHDFNIAGNQTAQSDWTVQQQTYNGQNTDTIISGVQYKVVGGCDGDKVSFQVVHPTAGVLDEFAKNFYVFKDEINTIKEHRANIPAGLIVRVVYVSTCATDARFIMNIFRYTETE